MHGRLDIPELVPLYKEFRDMPVVSISDAQRSPLPDANWVATVYHGLPADLFRFQPSAGTYLAFLGRISPEKRVDRAIEIARRSGMPHPNRRKSGPVDGDISRRTSSRSSRLHSSSTWARSAKARSRSFSAAPMALLFPIDWREPFGLVMIEAMACGTPVVAWRGGSVPEVITEGETGFVVTDIDDGGGARACVPPLSIAGAAGEVFEERFTAQRMARDYVAMSTRR